MTRIVGAFEAKTKFSELLDLVEQGQEILISRRGKTVARLTMPSVEGRRLKRARQAIARIKRLGREARLPNGKTVRDLIEDGRT